MLRMGLDIEVQGQRKKRRMKMSWKQQVEAESIKVVLSRKL